MVLMLVLAPRLVLVPLLWCRLVPMMVPMIVPMSVPMQMPVPMPKLTDAGASAARLSPCVTQQTTTQLGTMLKRGLGWSGLEYGRASRA